MAEPFIPHLHIIHAQLSYTYIHIYNLTAYLKLTNIKGITIFKTNKKHIKLKLAFTTNKREHFPSIAEFAIHILIDKTS